MREAEVEPAYWATLRATESLKDLGRRRGEVGMGLC